MDLPVEDFLTTEKLVALREQWMNETLPKRKREEAFNRILASYRRLIRMFVRRYTYRIQSRCIFSPQELFMHGMHGIQLALIRFKPEKGPLLSYAWSYVEEEIRQAVCESLFSHIPTINKNCARRLIFARPYTCPHPAGSLEAAKWIKDVVGIHDASVEVVYRTLFLLQNAPMALDQPIGGQEQDDGGGDGHDVLADTAPSPEDVCISRLTRERALAVLPKALQTLSERERIILVQREMRDNPPTLEELATQFCISKERVRQIQLRAKQKVREHMITSGITESGITECRA